MNDKFRPALAELLVPREELPPVHRRLGLQHGGADELQPRRQDLAALDVGAPDGEQRLDGVLATEDRLLGS